MRSVVEPLDVDAVDALVLVQLEVAVQDDRVDGAVFHNGGDDKLADLDGQNDWNWIKVR